MRVVLQRVSQASVEVAGEIVGAIKTGYLLLIGVEAADEPEDIDWLVRKIVGTRLFSDEDGKMNLALGEVEGGVLAVSQFTLHASCKKGNRPSFTRAAHPDRAEPMYEKFCEEMSEALGKPVERGVFGGDMKVALLNDGPVTIILDSKARDF